MSIARDGDVKNMISAFVILRRQLNALCSKLKATVRIYYFNPPKLLSDKRRHRVNPLVANNFNEKLSTSLG